MLKELEIKPSFNYWAPYIGKYTRRSKIVLNIEHKKVSKINGKFEKDCREMTEERILDMLTNDSYLKVKNTAKSCKLSTTGSKMDIIMRLKNAIANNDNNFKKLFSKLWGHSGGWLSFCCQHGIVYYLKFILRAESPRDYVDGLLSLAYIPNIVVVDMAHIVAKHATSSRKGDAKYYGKYDKEGNIFNPFNGRVADPEDQDIVQMANYNNIHVSFPWIAKQEQQKNKTCTESNTHPVTGSDVHLCLFDKFHERNTTSKTEVLRSIGNITELNGKFNSEIEEQLHLKFDNDKKKLNMMQPTTHVYLFRSIINHHNNLLNKKCLRDFEIRLQFPVKRNNLGSLV